MRYPLTLALRLTDWLTSWVEMPGLFAAAKLAALRRRIVRRMI